jgi:hypothetical protein
MLQASTFTERVAVFDEALEDASAVVRFRAS